MNKILWIAAHTTGMGDSPHFVRKTLTQDFVDKVKSIAALVAEHDLTEARYFGGPDHWGPDCKDESQRFGSVEGHEVCVIKSAFWFNARAKRSDDEIQSCGMSIQDLEEALASDAQHVFHDEEGGERLREAILDYEDVNLPEEL